ncbi:MAG: hypothetical protein EZS28_025549 [Streblomastix strix]|uniref:KilA-N domain-containing protein n=1 Tax=Streblomastix strix TaxID=222440 RepID=A0A5J4V8W0_9EUKA|nr:MAG: hypothetical protein EZS28_025549 [Streblomastix strix]
MEAQTTTQQITSNNETFIIGSYNGFDILIRNKDGFINATKLVQQINEMEHTKKELRNITRSPVFIEYKQFLEKIRPFNLNGPLCYLLPASFMNDVRGTYVHKQLLNIICIKSSVKYLHHVSLIMDAINERILATHDETTSIQEHAEETFNMVIEEQNIIIEEQSKEIKQLKPRAVPKDKETSYILAIELEDEWQGKITYQVRRLNKKHLCKKEINLLKQSVLFFDNLPIAMTTNEKLKEGLQKEFTDIDFFSNKITVPEADDQKLLDSISRIIEALYQ